MSDYNELITWFADTWHVWVVTITLVVAAVIDGIQLKVPNWITYPMIVSAAGSTVRFFRLIQAGKAFGSA